MVCKGEMSSWVTVTNGIPQGSVIGPVLFLVYINDLPAKLQSKVQLFADDTIVYMAVTNKTDAAILQKDLKLLKERENRSQTSFHPDKCNMNMENQKAMLLMLLDLSATFDTMDHRILLDHLQFDFGISGSALNWIESYLSNRTQQIYIDGVLSSNFNLQFGVPQGSCLGPLLFSLYASKLFKIIE